MCVYTQCIYLSRYTFTKSLHFACNQSYLRFGSIFARTVALHIPIKNRRSVYLFDWIIIDWSHRSPRKFSQNNWYTRTFATLRLKYSQMGRFLMVEKIQFSGTSVHRDVEVIPLYKFWKILEHKRHFEASHWDLNKLTHFNRYFDEYFDLVKIPV